MLWMMQQFGRWAGCDFIAWAPRLHTDGSAARHRFVFIASCETLDCTFLV